MTLAPVVVDFEDFLAVLTGQTGATFSRAMPWLDKEARDGGPYSVDMRGVIVQPGELPEAASTTTAIYVTRYDPSGQYRLEEAGSLGPPAGPCPLVQFGRSVCLHDVDVVEHADSYEVALVWSTSSRLPVDLTVFTHVGTPGRPPASQADGYAWRGALPLADWPPGKLIRDVRTLTKPDHGAEPTSLQVGVYDLVTGERLPAESLPGQRRRLPDGAWVQPLDR
jgi:hypothetical protein